MRSAVRRPSITREVPAVRLAGVFSVDLPDGRRLTGRRWPGHGDPLVLIHGLFADSACWADVARRTGRPALAIDLPGFRGSDLPVTPRIDCYADDVAFALEALNVRRATVVGHSFGGAAAAALAERSSAVESLVLLAPAGFGRMRLIELLTLPVLVDVASLALPLAFANPFVLSASYAVFAGRGRLPGRRLVAHLRADAARAPRGVRAAATAIAARGRDDRRRLRFDGRVGVLWGADDTVVPVGHTAGVRIAFPQAEVETWPGMGHHPQEEHLAALVSFVERYTPDVGIAAAA
jgi:pimeloyl-ACP methyl ester carboxylesterase